LLLQDLLNSKTEETNGAPKKKIESWRAYEEKRGSHKFCEKWRERREWLTLNSQNETESKNERLSINSYPGRNEIPKTDGNGHDYRDTKS
jgi:hypothetical protein